MMKTNSLLIALLMIVSSTKAQEIKEEKVTTDIKTVTVFLDGADITRSKTISILPGKTKIVFTGLSPVLAPKSIRVKIASEIDILSVNSKLNFLLSEELSPKIAKLKDSLELVNKKITKLKDEENSYSAEFNLLMENQAFAGDAAGITMAGLLESATIYRNRVKEINFSKSKLKQKSARLKKTRNRIIQQLNILKYKSNYKRSEVTVLISAKKAITTQIELKYIVRNAGWVPVYDIKAEDINKPISLKYKAKVFNDTDIDWKDIQIKLSTGDPSLNASKPILRPWYLSYNRKKYKTVSCPTFSTVEYDDSEVKSFAIAEDSDEEVSSASEPISDMLGVYKAKIASTNRPVPTGQTIQVADLSTEFEIKDKYSIVADAQPYFVEINTYNLPATYKHFTAPKKDQSVFLLARVTGWEDLNLVSGMANIYFSDSFVGLSFINTASTNDTLDISLGRDAKVIVTREKQKEFSRRLVLGANRKDILAYEIVIKNNRSTPINIEILDQLPVTRNSSIEIGEIEIQEADHNDITGELKWTFNIAPSENKIIKLSFFVKYPKKKPVQLNQTRHMNARYM